MVACNVWVHKAYEFIQVIKTFPRVINMRAKVVDFGLARVFPKVADGKSFMNVGYVANELALGELGPKLDIYSLVV